MSKLLSEYLLVFPDGSKVSAGQHLQDKIVMLFFSADWCGTCKVMEPCIRKFYEEIRASGHPLEIVFVSLDDSEAETEKYVAELKSPWPRMEFGKGMVKADDETMRQHGSGKGIPTRCFDTYTIHCIPTLIMIKPCGAIVVDAMLEELGKEMLECGICHCQSEVGEFWFKCTTCGEDTNSYEVCKKCKMHLQFREDHRFEEVKCEEINANDLWTKWMKKYNEPTDHK